MKNITLPSKLSPPSTLKFRKNTCIKDYCITSHVQKILFILICIILLTQNIFAYSPILQETEPNNTPMNATKFSGESTLIGTLGQGDQDAFKWKINSDESQYSWDIELRGIPNAITRIDIMKVTLTKDGRNVEDYRKFFSFGTKTGNKPIYLQNLLLEEGEYLIAVSSKYTKGLSTSKDYRIRFTKKSKTLLQNEKNKKHATTVYNNSFPSPQPYLLQHKTGWFTFSISKEKSKKLWTLQGATTIGHKLEVLLVDKDNNTIAKTTSNHFAKYTLNDLELEEGQYYIQYKTHTKGIKSTLSLYSSGSIKIDKNEVEPNNTIEYANLIKYNKTIHGTVSTKDNNDFYIFSLPETFRNKRFSISLDGNLSNIAISLLNKQGKKLQTKTKDSNYTMSNLVLKTSESYILQVSGNKLTTDYTLSFSDRKDYNNSKEIEPNDSRITSFSIATETTLYGKFKGEEWDCFDFSVQRSKKLWELRATGKYLDRVILYKGQKETLFDINTKYNNEIRIKNLLLSSGIYKSCVHGKNGNYSFLIHHDDNISVDELNIEHEPNQDKSQTNELKFGQTIKGTLESIGNEDYFHFTLKNDEHIRLTATPPKEGDSKIKLISGILTHRSYPKVGKVSILEGVYPPGRYIIDLWTKKENYEMYSLELKRLNPFMSTDIEPNDNYALANELPLSFHLKGFTANDKDYFKFSKYMRGETNLSISGENLKGNILIYPDTKSSHVPLKWDNSSQTYFVSLKHPDTSYIAISANTGRYDYNLSFSSYQPSNQRELILSLAIKRLQNNTVASYAEYGQRLKYILDIESKKDINLTLISHISDASWKLDLNKSISVTKNEKLSLPLTLYVPKNIEESPVSITLKLMNKNKDFKTITFKVVPSTQATVVNPYDDWGLPDSILGGINVARLDFGAKRVLTYKESKLGYVPNVMKYTHSLFNTFNQNLGSSFYLHDKRKHVDENISIALAGEESSEVMGVILNPRAYTNKNNQLKDFSISLSEDGNNYTSVYRGELEVEGKDQAFVFDRPYRAKYAKLTLHNNQSKQTNKEIYLGEWKVIARQKSLSIRNAFNIASPKLGGHIVQASKILSKKWDRSLLSKKEDSYDIYLYKKEKELTWTVGFKNERVAKVTHMVWRERSKSKKRTYMKPLKVLISTQTPIGPWKELNTWYKSDNNISTYTFEKPIWARYVKFIFPIEKDGYYSPPEELQIFEKKPDMDYMSILGEWGEKNHHSFYEYQQTKKNKTISVITGNETKNNAYLLEQNETINGRVSVANHEEDWYHIKIPKKHNQFKLELFGKESVDVKYELYDSNHSKIKAFEEEKNPLSYHVTFEIKEGDYYLKIKQPPVSVIFAWDNSDSVAPYHTQIFDAVNNYTRSIQKNIDAVNLLCFYSISTLFTNPFLLSGFSDNPTQIQTIFDNFDRNCDSSDAEIALKDASRELKNRDGTKGVIIIGDGVGKRDNSLWDTLAEVKPKVFSIRVVSQSHENEIYEGIMQSWTRVNNGSYSVVNNGIELYHAINHASAVLRRPVYYGLNMHTNYTQPLGPGYLKISTPKAYKKKVKKNLAIELILDASGSMLKRIEGKRRISIAKDVLKKAVKDIIPKGTPVALRVFGHKKADSCRTDLEMPLQALNVKKTTKIIARIKAKNLAKTPIADSLAKVADDLSDVKGKKIIILVTDGEETCDGDPTKVIQALKKKGIDIRINIVGFAIDNQSLKEQFKEWAKIGEGSYFDARDKDSLEQAVKDALQVPYKVYDNEKNLLMKSIVDSDPIRLKKGIYTVVIESYPKQTIEHVVITGEQTRTIVLKEK